MLQCGLMKSAIMKIFFEVYFDMSLTRLSSRHSRRQKNFDLSKQTDTLHRFKIGTNFPKPNVTYFSYFSQVHRECLRLF